MGHMDITFGPQISLPQSRAAWKVCSGQWLLGEEQASAAGCIISNLYKALKGIQWSNWEALKLKWGWDLESTLEPVVWRKAWGSISSVLISREPNINVFWHFYSSSPGVYTRVGFLFGLFFFSFSVIFLHSEASFKCNLGRGVLLQCLGHHHFSQVWLLDRACPLTDGSCYAQVGHQQSWDLDVLQGSGRQGELCPSQQPQGCSQRWLSLPKPQPCISPAPL